MSRMLTIFKALSLREVTEEVEEKEEGLVLDCIEQLGMMIVFSLLKPLFLQLGNQESHMEDF